MLLSIDFRSSRLLLASLILFCSEMVAPRVTLLRHLRRSYDVTLSQLLGSMLTLLTEAFSVSLKRYFGPPSEHFSVRSSPQRILYAFLWHTDHMTDPSQLVMFALVRTSVSGILSCHLIFIDFLRRLMRKWLSF